MKVLGCFFVSLLWVFLVICYLWWIRKGPVIPAHNTLQRQTEFRAEKTTRQQKTKVFIFIRWTQETRYILVKRFLLLWDGRGHLWPLPLCLPSAQSTLQKPPSFTSCLTSPHFDTWGNPSFYPISCWHLFFRKVSSLRFYKPSPLLVFPPSLLPLLIFKDPFLHVPQQLIPWCAHTSFSRCPPRPLDSLPGGSAEYSCVSKSDGKLCWETE